MGFDALFTAFATILTGGSVLYLFGGILLCL
jgi:hypothetical protein